MTPSWYLGAGVVTRLLAKVTGTHLVLSCLMLLDEVSFVSSFLWIRQK